MYVKLIVHCVKSQEINYNALRQFIPMQKLERNPLISKNLFTDSYVTDEVRIRT